MAMCSFCPNQSLHTKKNEIPLYRLHRFNFNDPDWLEIWYKCKDRHPPRNAHICSTHFEKHMISDSKFLINDPRNDLLPFSKSMRVVPSINLPYIDSSLRKIQRKFRLKPFDPKAPIQRTKAISTTLNLTAEQLARMKELGIIRHSKCVTIPKKGSFLGRPPITRKEVIIKVPEPEPVEEVVQEQEEEPGNNEIIIIEEELEEEETEIEPEEIPLLEHSFVSNVYQQDQQEQQDQPEQISEAEQEEINIMPFESFEFTPSAQLDASTGILMDYTEFLHKDDHGETSMLPPNFDEDMTEIICNTNEETYGDIDLNCDQDFPNEQPLCPTEETVSPPPSEDEEELDDENEDYVNTENVLIENCRTLFLDSIDFCETSLDFISIFHHAEIVKLSNCKFSSIMTLKSILCCCKNLSNLKIIHPILVHQGGLDSENKKPRRMKQIPEDWIEHFELALSDGKSWEVIKVFETIQMKIRSLEITLDYICEDATVNYIPNFDKIESLIVYIHETFAGNLKSLRINNGFNPFTNQSQSNEVIQYLMNITDLKLKKFSGSSFGNDRLFETFVSQQTEITHFSLSESIITECEFMNIGQYLSKLTHLDLTINTRNFENKNIDSVIKNLPHLRSLKLFMAEAYLIQLQFPKSLREFDMKCSLGDPKLVLLPAPHHLNKMEKLSLSRVSVEKSSFQEIFKNMTNLKFLRLFPIEKMTSEHLLGDSVAGESPMYSLKCLKKLESLCLLDDVVNDRVLLEVQSRALKHLHLKNGFYKKELTISEQGLLHLAMMCPNLIAIRHHRLNVYKRCIETGLFAKDLAANSGESCWRPGQGTDDVDDFG